MSCFEVTYKNNKKYMRPVNSFAEFAKIRNTRENRRYTKAAREGNPEAKRRMVQMCYSCLPNDDGSLRGTKRMSNSVGMDVDFDKGMPKEKFDEAFKLMKESILEMADKLGLLMLERSATKGLHLVFERHPEMTQEENLEWAQKMLGVEFDKGAKDITRVFFSPTADPKDLFFCKDELFTGNDREVKLTKENEKSGPKSSSTKIGKNSDNKKVDENHDNKATETAEGKTQMAGDAPSADDVNAAATSTTTAEPDDGETYNDIPYAEIIREFWVQNNDGKEPCEGNRNALTFELAKALRSICDYSLDRLKKLIPRYDNFPEDEYVRTLQNALDEPRKGINYKLQKVLSVLYAKQEGGGGKLDFDAENAEPPQMPKTLPYPLNFLSANVPEIYRAAVCESVFAPLSVYVHGVKMRYWDGVEHEPTFMSVLSAKMSIGKGCIRQPIKIILEDVVNRDKANRDREGEWKQKNPTSKQKRDKRPDDICVQVLIDNLTDAVFNQRVADADRNGHRYLYTCVDELDTLKKITSRGTASEVCVIIRKAFDNSNHGQERVGADSVTGIAPLRFNFNASTTNRCCQQFFSREMTTGTVTRLSMATILKPDNAPRPVFKEYDQEYKDEVRRLTDKLSLLSGEIDCPMCNDFAERLCDENEKLASLYGSEPYLVLSYRATVIAWLKGMLLYAMNDETWTDEIQQYVEWSLRYDLWVKMRIFGPMLDEAFNDEEKATNKKGPMNMLMLLQKEFKIEDLILVRKRLGKSGDMQSAKAQLFTWRTRRLVDFDDINGIIKNLSRKTKT